MTLKQRPSGCRGVSETCGYLEEECSGGGNTMCKASEQGEDLACLRPGGQSNWSGGMEREREERTRGRRDRAGFRQRVLRIKPQCSVWQLLFLSQQA